jgi:hypothetical protein
LRDALVKAGAGDDLADEAAAEVAGHRNRVAGIEADLKLIKWMSGVLLAMLVVLLFRSVTR